MARCMTLKNYQVKHNGKDCKNDEETMMTTTMMMMMCYDLMCELARGQLSYSTQSPVKTDMPEKHRRKRKTAGVHGVSPVVEM